MNIFGEIELIYVEIDARYYNMFNDAKTNGHIHKEALYTRKRELNDMAYFLFMFTRLEDRIRDLSNKLITSKSASLTKWENKRTWDILEKKKNSIHLMDRVALLTKINQTDYNLIKLYYSQRNEIGHGGNFTILINIPNFIVDMKRLFKDLKA